MNIHVSCYVHVKKEDSGDTEDVSESCTQSVSIIFNDLSYFLLNGMTVFKFEDLLSNSYVVQNAPDTDAPPPIEFNSSHTLVDPTAGPTITKRSMKPVPSGANSAV